MFTILRTKIWKNYVKVWQILKICEKLDKVCPKLHKNKEEMWVLHKNRETLTKLLVSFLKVDSIWKI